MTNYECFNSARWGLRGKVGMGDVGGYGDG